MLEAFFIVLVMVAIVILSRNVQHGQWQEIMKIIFLLVIVLFMLAPWLVKTVFHLPFVIVRVPWSEVEALSYVSGALSCFGTVLIGYIAWKQSENASEQSEKLMQLSRVQQDIDKRRFIAENSCMVLLSELKFSKVHTTIEDMHSESIIQQKELESGTFNSSFEIEVLLKRLDHYASMVHIDSLRMYFSHGEEIIPIEAVKYDDYYSSIDISEKADKFKVTVLVRQDAAQKLIDALEHPCEIAMETYLSLVTPYYVCTKIRCSAAFRSSDSTPKDFVLVDQNPTCSWIGNEILNEKDVKSRPMRSDI